jgi:hypothetical protein
MKTKVSMDLRRRNEQQHHDYIIGIKEHKI